MAVSLLGLEIHQLEFPSLQPSYLEFCKLCRAGRTLRKFRLSLLALYSVYYLSLLSVHYIIERFVKPKNKLKEASKDVYYNITHSLVSSMLIYSAPLIFTSIGVLLLSLERGVGCLTSVLKELWLWEPFCCL